MSKEQNSGNYKLNKEGIKAVDTTLKHSQKKRKDSPETRAVLCVYVENQAILEPILPYRASKCKQTKEVSSEDCLWTHIFTFLRDYYTFFSFFCQNANITGSNCAITVLSVSHDYA